MLPFAASDATPFLELIGSQRPLGLSLAVRCDQLHPDFEVDVVGHRLSASIAKSDEHQSGMIGSRAVIVVRSLVDHV